MAFTVRAFGYRGTTQLPINLPKQFSSDSIQQLTQPYEWAEQLTTNGVTPQSLTAPADSNASQTRIIRIEVPDGQTIRYEINPPTRQGGVVAASADSPQLSGINMFEFHGGWSLSVIDATGT